MRFGDILEKVKDTIECKYNAFGSPTAFKIHNDEEYRLVLEYVNMAHMSCCDYAEHYEYDYKGEDWYFFLESKEDLGMEGRFTRYWQETLTDKKNNFNKFLEQFENE